MEELMDEEEKTLLDERQNANAQILLQQKQAVLQMQLAENKRLMQSVKRKRPVTHSERSFLSGLIEESEKGDLGSMNVIVV